MPVPRSSSRASSCWTPRWRRPFVDLPDERKVAALKEIEGSDFFNDVRGATVRGLYRNPAVRARLGYEGPSSHLGGYVKRGFDDAAWVPEE